MGEAVLSEMLESCRSGGIFHYVISGLASKNKPPSEGRLHTLKVPGHKLGKFPPAMSKDLCKQPSLDQHK